LIETAIKDAALSTPHYTDLSVIQFSNASIYTISWIRKTRK